MFLSKSLFIKGLQCPKALWLKKHKSEVLSKPDPSIEARFKTGDEVGELAYKLFAKGVKIEFEGSSFEEKCEQTKELLKQKQGVIYEATFCFDGILVMVDILEFDESGLSLNEVKSSTSLKEVYVDDLAIQYFVISNLHYKIKNARLIHIDNSYIRGDELEPQKLFMQNEILDKVLEKQAQIPEILRKFKHILSTNTEPDDDIGEQCFAPYECDGFEYCWEKQRGIVGEENVFSVSRLATKRKFELYRQGQWRFDKLTSLEPFNTSQQIQIQASLEKSVHINKEAIKTFLEGLTYPVYHLDFETFMQAVPEFKGTKPFMQIPFQYSIHIDFNEGKTEHLEFLASAGVDPRYELAKNLCQAIPENACVLAYNASFEKSVIENLANDFKDLREKLIHIKDHIQDLMLVFKDKHYYHHLMQGSYSIKKVLPALLPEFELAYKNLELIHNGSEAMQCFALLKKMSKSEQESYRKALLEYCKLDTLAMVKILEHLQSVVR